MNKNLYNFIKNKINTISIDDLERDLRAFGIECERKVEIINTERSSILFDEFEGTEYVLSFKLSIDQVDYMVANDNCYALAA
jgi:hypothetical protein